MIISVTNKQRRHALLAALLFIVLAVLIGTNATWPANMDEEVRFFMTGIQTSYGDVIMSIATFLGSPVMNLFYGVLLALVLLLADLKLPSLWVIITVFGAVIMTQIIKVIIHRDRPIGHLLTDNGASFPSQHVMAMWLTVFVMFLLVTPNISSTLIRILTKWFLITLALLTMLSRLYFSAHFLTDTVGAFLLAYVWVIFCGSLYPSVATFLKKKFWLFKDQEA
ncbi:phosphatase PAP2 family protein [Fructobacillus sp. M1-13]|uniref:Phosphatase PAP2 family protein n=1 Tax=Fructobacillus papyriferae TaxID=2713171 RepID=A0ABS5QQ71_9LACO|nr:phosphatase PAP2 family protein [Fructobacillus papyriferae]MBS9335334.1 phosphatase PAP2 family protein [Fructobacillus papyriferae]MCD2158997.1 phosphatase PAP2 family protein [Fructobacillus papyriferae]